MQTTVVGNYPKIPNRPKPARLRQAINRRDRGEITIEELARDRGRGDDRGHPGADRGRASISSPTARCAGTTIRLMSCAISAASRSAGCSATSTPTPTTASRRSPAPSRGESRFSCRDYRFAAENSQKPVKAIITGPYTLAALSLDKHYGSREKLAMALAEELSQRGARRWCDAGAKMIQVNDPVIVFHKDDVDIFARAITRMLDGVERRDRRSTPGSASVAGILPAAAGHCPPTSWASTSSAVATTGTRSSPSRFEKKLGVRHRRRPQHPHGDGASRSSEAIDAGRQRICPA